MLHNLRLGYKIAGAFFIIVILIIISGVVTLSRIDTLSSANKLIEHSALPSIRLMGKIRYGVSSVRRLESQAALIDGDERKSLFGRQEKLKDQALLDIKEMITHVGGDPAAKETIAYKKLLDTLQARTLDYFIDNTNTINTISNGDIEGAKTSIFNDSRKSYSAMMDAVEAVFTSNDAFVKAQGELIDKEHNAAIYITALGISLAAISALFLAWFTTKQIINPINQAADAAEKVANGDLTTKITIVNNDEIGQLLNTIAHMQSSLINLVKNVRSGSEGVSTASAEIAAGNHDLSSRTESQASALQQTAASMEELSGTVGQNADNARVAASLASQAAAKAATGGKVVGQVALTMQDINDASKKITDIISVIDGIAFQTNILALNAAVEAARAGDAGRGFAVVATEVRSLAGRSADAAKQIKVLIGASVAKVTDGVTLANDAGNRMTEVVEAIQKVADIVGEISIASREQAMGVAQVGEAVTSMDQVTQQNAALVEEMAAAASSLKQQATDLVTEVSIFKI